MLTPGWRQRIILFFLCQARAPHPRVGARPDTKIRKKKGYVSYRWEATWLPTVR